MAIFVGKQRKLFSHLYPLHKFGWPQIANIALELCALLLFLWNFLLDLIVRHNPEIELHFDSSKTVYSFANEFNLGTVTLVDLT